nr:dienelactone hydrolase [Rhizobium sp. Q54]
MRFLFSILVLFCASVGAAAQPTSKASKLTGVRWIDIHSAERNRDIPVFVWYPAGPGGRSIKVGENAFFVGADAMLNAPVSQGRYPVILLSHGAGLGGTPEAASWIAAPLAKRGFVVAAPLHPGNGGSGRSAAETMKLWLRSSDISATLDALEQQPFLQAHLEQAKVGVLGLSMGGNTALSLAGGRIDQARVASYCDDAARNPSLCGWVRQSGVDLHAMDMGPADRDNHDERIKFALAIDPAPVDVFEVASFLRVSIPVEIINLGPPEAIPLTALASGIAGAIPASRYRVLPEASHYSMFGVCKPDAPALAKSEGIEEPICSDGNGQSRAKIHQELIEAASRAFRKWLEW